MSYLFNAYNYIKWIFTYVDNWNDMDNMVDACDKVFWHTGKHAHMEIGSARYVIIGKDFVIKYDYDKDAVETIGGCEEEYNMWLKVRNTQYSNLFAPIARIYYKGKCFYIMPRVHNIGPREHGYKKLKECVTKKEWEWLINNIGDIHSYNWGLENNRPIMIDYACRPFS